ncbi:hypothetical protein [Cohnella cholangitidis]|uniref:Uncharacterized protein n=1 Tax=Cohnella cholangitidis TaxID=2598458 RepID=A0A7G5BSR3_9BACL|nr:hypothetical protein [Cohnella cholangitidis]QMV39997.1 hypothetical protein FPL14_01335 [Cohnella cholangitidis]
MRRKTWTVTLEWGLAIVLIVLFFWKGLDMLGSTTATKAHERSERSYHYGPSQIVREIPYKDDIVIFLGSYKKWFSADTSVKKGWRWFPGGGVGGVEIDQSKKISYSWDITRYKRDRWLAKFYGYVSDPRIVKFELEVINTDGEKVKATQADKPNWTVLSETITDDRMFLFLWDENEIRYKWKSLRGLDAGGQLLFEQSLNS